MKKLSEEAKKQIYGGIGPMMLWVGIMGGVAILQTLVSSVTSVFDTFNQSSDSQNKNYASASKHNSMYMRVSPMPMRSAFSMWM